MIKRQDSSQLLALEREIPQIATGGESSSEQQAKVVIGATYWRPWHDLDIAEWIVLGRRLGTFGRGVAWWIGDWVNYGNAKFGEKYSRAARITGYDVQSLMNMAYVASRFDCSRRRENLSWSHHAELAGLPVKYQEMWLENAEQKHISVHGLREALRTWRVRRLATSNDPDQTRRNAGHAQDDRAKGPGDAEVVCPQCGYRMEADIEPERNNSHADIPAPGALRHEMVK